MSRVGILGGTFDPIHHGHLILASFAFDELGLERIVFMPAQTPPHRSVDLVTPANDRVAMIERAISADPRFEISRLDLTERKPSYTSELLERLTREEPDAQIWFLIGADSLRTFPGWHEPGRILELAQLGVAQRPGVEINDPMLDALPALRYRTTIFSSPLIEISSTGIRERVADRKAITWLVPSDVEKYIHEHGLYLDGQVTR